MLIAGSHSPRTASRLDPTSKSTPRLCKVAFETNSNQAADDADQEVFVISSSRSSLLYPNESSPKRRASVSLPEISSALFHANDSDESTSSESPELIALPDVDKSSNSATEFQSGNIFQDFNNVDDIRSSFISTDDNDQEKDMTIIDLVSYANNPPKNRSTRQKYRHVRSAFQSRDVGNSGKAIKSHSARRPRRQNEETYLKCKFHERPCSRIGSFWREDESNDLSRECCDVLGPRSCRECFRISQRLKSKSSNADLFPDIAATPSEFFTLDLTQRMFPDLSTMDVLHHFKEGNISTEVLQKRQLQSYAEVRRIRSAAEKSRKIRERVNLFKAHEDDNFFKNFNDLKLQMVLKRKKTTDAVPLLEPVRPLSSRHPPLEIEMIPVAIDDRENPANYFEPPIMTQEEIIRQKSQPRFYAGRSSEYKLPETTEMGNVLRESNKAIRNLNSSASLKFGIIEEEEEQEEEQEEEADEDGGNEEGAIGENTSRKDPLLSSASLDFYKHTHGNETLDELRNETANKPGYRGRFSESADILDTDEFFSPDAQKLDSSSDESSSSSNEEDNTS